MKKYCTLLLWLALTYTSTAQKLKVDEVDEFTNKSVKRTSWETLNSDFSSNIYLRVSELDGYLILNLKLMKVNKSVLSVHEDMRLMLKMQNDSIVTLHAIESTVSCRGCGAIGLFGGGSAWGIEINYDITESEFYALRNLPVKKIRLYTTDGYIEEDISNKNADLIIRLLYLLENQS